MTTNARIKTLLKVLVAIVIVIMLLIAGFIIYLNSSVKSSVKKKMSTTRESISLLNNDGYSIFSSYGGFYKLDENGEWKLLIPGIQGDHHQEVYLCDDYLYFYDLYHDAIKRVQITNSNKMETVVKTERRPGYIGVSKGKERLAYSNDKDVFVFLKGSDKTWPAPRKLLQVM